MDNAQNRRADDKRAPGVLQWGEPAASATAASASADNPSTAGAAKGGIDWIYRVVRDVAELDLDSSEDEPDMMLVTSDELFNIVRRHAPVAAPALKPSEGRAAALEEVAQFFEMQDGSPASKKEMAVAAQLARLLATKPAGWAQQSGESLTGKEHGADHG